MTDKAVIEKRVFYVALNPVDQTTAQSIWAAGRVPSDVTKITYRLPGGQVVEAKLNNDGYWMLMFHKSNLGIAPGNVEDWPPIVVTSAVPPVISASLSSSATRQCATRCLTAADDHLTGLLAMASDRDSGSARCPGFFIKSCPKSRVASNIHSIFVSGLP